MTRSLTFILFVLFLFSRGISAFSQIAINELDEANCNYLFKKVVSQYGQEDSNTLKNNYQACESCCKVMGNDSLLLRLYLLDTLSLFSDKELHRNLLEENKKNGALSYCKTLYNSYSKVAFYYSKQNVDTGLKYYNEANSLQKKCNDIKGYATSLQNIAFNYEDKKKQTAMALQYSLESLAAWNSIQDTFGLANMYKYIGYLLGKEGNFERGEANINKAIELFSSIDFEQGIAVSYYDMALLQINKKNVDSALNYLFLSKNIWKKYNDEFRIFKINNALLEIYIDRKNIKSANKVFEESLKSSEISSKIIPSDRRKFYELAAIFYHNKKDDLHEREFLSKRNNIPDVSP
jgi:tetratricopeptide (TPR) repeat protein